MEDKLKEIALEVFGSNDGVKPRFPKTGQKIQEAMEISFKAGQEDVCTVAVSRFIEQGRQEVVEWIEGKNHHDKEQSYYQFNGLEWQAKLKSWGI